MNRPPSLLDLQPGELRPMTREESEVLILLTLSKRDETRPMDENGALAQERGWNAVGVGNGGLRPRLALAGIYVTEPAFVLAVSWCGVRPGDVILWAYTFLEIARRGGKTLLTVNDLVMAFPFGIPTDAGMRRIWDAQKYFDGSEDNWLDLEKAWTLEAVAA